MKVPTGKSVTITWGAVSGYATPATNTFTATGTSMQYEGVYNTTIVTVKMTDNQTAYDDIASATASVSASGMTTATVSNNGTAKVPTGASCTITWSAVSGYKTPDKQTFTTSGTSVTKTGTYQTEIVTVNVSSDIAMPSSYTITVSGIGSQTTASKVYKVPFGTSYTVSATAAGGYKTPETQTFTASQSSRTVSVVYLEKTIELPSISGVTDLSKQDIHGNAIQTTTANCYVVKTAGTYAIPLVFGNAIKNGAVNADAYTNNGGANSHDFVDYNGNVITSPYIEDVSGEASSAQLSIADTDSVFTDISLANGTVGKYLKFKIASVPATGANGVLSVKDVSGVIMWSWHIWVWADDLSPVEITNNTGVKYKILPVNLASKWDDTAKTKIKNWFYQFGRPNPMLCPSTYNYGRDHASYGALSYAAANTALNIQTGIKNPATFYFNSSSDNYVWFQTNSNNTYNLWDAACTSTGNSDNNVVKTIYDPCPIGFKMPNGNAFTYFSTSNMIGSFNNGLYLKRNADDTIGVFFPMSGFRRYSDGSLYYIGSSSYVWFSSAKSTSNVYHLHLYSDSAYPQLSTYRAYGNSVRPVTDEAPKMPLENGVYIQAVDGTCYTESEWDGSKTPNGIAVKTDNCEFVMALQDAHTSSCKWGGYGKTVLGIVTTTDKSTAQADYAGTSNTDTIISELSGYNDSNVTGAPAAEYCKAFTFPNGKKGYLGAAGEWQAALDNKAAIVSALSKCGGSAMGNYYWTSTQCSSDNSWYMLWSNEDLKNYIKRINYFVRAFATI